MAGDKGDLTRIRENFRNGVYGFLGVQAAILTGLLFHQAANKKPGDSAETQSTPITAAPTNNLAVLIPPGP